MNLSKVYLSTLLPELPTIINHNNAEFKRYLDLFYNETTQILTVPLTTTGRVKGATGEFVNIIVDNLTVKNQYTNMYDNNTTADYNWYRMVVDPVFEPRDPCSGIWPYESIAGYKIIDVNKPYYKIDNEYPVVLSNNNLSQVVGVFCSADTVGTDAFTILMDPDPSSAEYMKTYTIDVSYAGVAYVEFIATDYDPSWGSTWQLYKYGYNESGGGSGGGGIVGPGTPNYIAMFETTNTIGDSPLSISTDGSIMLNGVEWGTYQGIGLADDLKMPEAVGGLPVDTSVAYLRGKTFEWLFSEILFPTVPAYIGTLNFVNISGYTSTTPVEVGTTYSPTITATYNRGTIYDGDGTLNTNALTGLPALYTFGYYVDGSLVYSRQIMSFDLTETHVYDPLRIELGNNTWSAIVNYSTGSGIYYDNKGGTSLVPSIETARSAGFSTGTSDIVRGRRKYFTGSGDASVPIDSSSVRALADQGLFENIYNTGTFTFEISPGNTYAYFFIPDGSSSVVVQLEESSYADITDDFDTPTDISVNDAGGVAQNYKSWIHYIGGVGYDASVHYKVTIS